MVTRMLEIPLSRRKSFFLFGPRGTGKTWWVKRQLPEAHYFDLLDMSLYQQLLANPHSLVELIPKNYKGWIIIDEIQRIPALLNEVHRLIEAKCYTFVLTGSSARTLRRQGVNLLAGRALVYHMYPLVAQELGEQFDIKKSLKFGQLPALLTEPEPKAYLDAYVATYLREEVLQEGLTRNLSAFSRFLEVASFSQGQVLNVSSVARECGINQKSVSNYFDILDDLLLGYRLPVFNKRAQRQTVRHPKFYFFDVGIYQNIRPRGIIDSSEEIEGPALETLFLQSLRAINDYNALDYQLYYWRTKTGLEVDFILYGEKGFHAFEIKRSAQIPKRVTRGLRAFKQEFPEAKCHLIYGGNQICYLDDFTVWPIADALKKLPEIIKEQK